MKTLNRFRYTKVLGANIRERRLEMGLTQSELADFAAIDLSNVGKIERGVTNPSLETMIRIAAILETTVSKLTKGITSEHIDDKPRTITVKEFLRAKGYIV